MNVSRHLGTDGVDRCSSKSGCLPETLQRSPRVRQIAGRAVDRRSGEAKLEPKRNSKPTDAKLVTHTRPSRARSVRLLFVRFPLPSLPSIVAAVPATVFAT